MSVYVFHCEFTRVHEGSCVFAWLFICLFVCLSACMYVSVCVHVLIGGLLIWAESDRRRKMVSYDLTIPTVVVFTARTQSAFTWSQSLPLQCIQSQPAWQRCPEYCAHVSRRHMTLLPYFLGGHVARSRTLLTRQRFLWHLASSTIFFGTDNSNNRA